MMKRLRIIAGPNGSGKSFFYNLLKEKTDTGIYINPDEIEALLKKEGRLSLSEYKIQNIDNSDFIDKYLSSPIISKNSNYSVNNFNVNDESISIIDKENIDSYVASFISEYIRETLLAQDNVKAFTFETVFSHPSKLAFLKLAKEHQFKIYLYYIATGSHIVNVGRVKQRVDAGGHDVPEEIIRKRYEKSLENLYDIILLSDRAFIFDNSGKSLSFIAESDGKILSFKRKTIPAWFDKYFIKKVQEKNKGIGRN